jgi:hypothetical protein
MAWGGTTAASQSKASAENPIRQFAMNPAFLICLPIVWINHYIAYGTVTLI